MGKPKWTFELNETIESDLIGYAISNSLLAVHERYFYMHTGDGILMFIVGEDAAFKGYEFVARLFARTFEVNQGKSDDDENRIEFRTGIATGPVALSEEYTPMYTGAAPERRVAGTVIARAVRLEASGERNSLVICEHTHNQISDFLKNRGKPNILNLGACKEVAGKAHEDWKLAAYQRQFIEEGMGEIIGVLEGLRA